MKKIILIGKSGSGKTTIAQALKEEEIRYQKTQSLEYRDNIIDSPGEYIENRRFYNALIITSLDCDIIGLIQDSTDEHNIFPPNFVTMFNKDSIGIITKMDKIGGDVLRAQKYLKSAGVKKIYETSAFTGEGIDEIRSLIDK